MTSAPTLITPSGSDAATRDAIREALTTAMMHSTAPMVLSDPYLSDCPMVVVNQPSPT